MQGDYHHVKLLMSLVGYEIGVEYRILLSVFAPHPNLLKMAHFLDAGDTIHCAGILTLPNSNSDNVKG